jgi:hypothetical protein
MIFFKRDNLQNPGHKPALPWQGAQQRKEEPALCREKPRKNRLGSAYTDSNKMLLRAVQSPPIKGGDKGDWGLGVSGCPNRIISWN